MQKLNKNELSYYQKLTELKNNRQNSFTKTKPIVK